jgi:D-tyrosyl-tRNA(Tyr) deacylase
LGEIIVMRAVIQRVSEARVRIAGATVGEIGPGLLVLLGLAPADTDADAQWLADKIAKLRIFPDAEGHMNRSLLDLAPAPVSDLLALNSQLSALNSQLSAPTALVVSQFTLFASTRKGTRPSYNDAAKPDLAIPLYQTFCRLLSAALGRPVATGQFGALMAVSLVNDGPVTLIIDSRLRE